MATSYGNISASCFPVPTSPVCSLLLQPAQNWRHNLKNILPKNMLAGHLCLCSSPFWWHFCAAVQCLHISVMLHDSSWSFQDERTSKQREFCHMYDPLDQLPVLSPCSAGLTVHHMNILPWVLAGGACSGCAPVCADNTSLSFTHQHQATFSPF